MSDLLTCIHAERGLCPACQRDYDESPSDYLEYGDHPAGLARWKALQEEIAAGAEAETIPVEEQGDIPF